MKKIENVKLTNLKLNDYKLSDASPADKRFNHPTPNSHAYNASHVSQLNNLDLDHNYNFVSATNSPVNSGQTILNQAYKREKELNMLFSPQKRTMEIKGKPEPLLKESVNEQKKF